VKKLRSPMTTFAIAVMGVGVAALSFRYWLFLPAVPLVAAAIVMPILTTAARSNLPLNPVRAVSLMNGRAICLAVIAVSGAAFLIVLGTQFIVAEPPTGATESAKAAYRETKELVGGATAALAALITTFVAKPEDMDGAVGEATRGIFSGKYGQTPFGVITPLDQGVSIDLPESSDAAESAFGSGDWEYEDRRDRARTIEDYLRQFNIGGSPQPNP